MIYIKKDKIYNFGCRSMYYSGTAANTDYWLLIEHLVMAVSDGEIYPYSSVVIIVKYSKFCYFSENCN